MSFDYGICQMNPCEDKKQCQMCVESVECGWCEAKKNLCTRFKK